MKHAFFLKPHIFWSMLCLFRLSNWKDHHQTNRPHSEMWKATPTASVLNLSVLFLVVKEIQKTFCWPLNQSLHFSLAEILLMIIWRYVQWKESRCTRLFHWQHQDICIVTKTPKCTTGWSQIWNFAKIAIPIQQSFN